MNTASDHSIEVFTTVISPYTPDTYAVKVRMMHDTSIPMQAHLTTSQARTLAADLLHAADHLERND